MDSQKRYDVFVSYRRRNAEGKEEGTHIARTIKLKLDLLMQNTDSCCFFDYSNMSNEDFPTRILKTIASAKVFVCVLTKNAMQRCGNEEDWVRREILQAKRCRLKIIFVNPDGQFTGEYPSNFPEELDFVRTTHHLKVHTDDSFDRDLQAIYDEEIQPILTHDNRVNQLQGALVRVHSDLECRVLDFGKQIATVGQNMTEIYLHKGNHELAFVGVESDVVRFDYGELDIRDLEYVTTIKVRLLDKCLLSGKGRNGVYKVGDYYDDGKKQGVVFEVTPDGKHGKIVSLTGSSEELMWSDASELGRLIGANDMHNGANNMAKVMQIADWREKYPAFAWCADLGEGWYLPAAEELLTIYRNKDIIEKSNQLKSFWGKYWSSSECGKYRVWGVGMYSGYTANFSKSGNRYVRAVSAF